MRSRVLSHLFRLCIVSLFPVYVLAYQSPPAKSGTVPPSSVATGHDNQDEDQLAPRDEMLKDVEIKHREAVYQENLDRAREAAQMGTEVREAYKNKRSLSAVEMKKLARIEKLARSIRNEVGGDDDNDALKEPPTQLDTALDRLVELSEDFRKLVEKTPRHVVSVSVINSANQLIELTKHIKALAG
jgi:hypothetical protein